MRRVLSTGIRFAIGAAAILWLLRGVEGAAALNSIGRAEGGWLLIAMFAQFGSKACWLYRWKVLLSSIGSAPKTLELGRLLLVGLFFNNFLPSSVGGDLARGLGLAASGVPRATAAASVLADRLVGLFALALTGILGATLGRLLAPGEGPWTAAALLSFGTAVGVGTLFHPRALLFYGKLPFLSKEAGPARKARRLLDAGRLLAGEGGALRRALVLSLGLSAFSTIYHGAIGRSLGIGIPFAAYFVIVPAVMLVSSLPITLNGLGIREVGFVQLLTAQGASRADATAFALLAFLGTLGFSIAGGLLLLGGDRRHFFPERRELG